MQDRGAGTLTVGHCLLAPCTHLNPFIFLKISFIYFFVVVLGLPCLQAFLQLG